MRQKMEREGVPNKRMSICKKQKTLAMEMKLESQI